MDADDQAVPAELAIRGYKVLKHEERTLEFAVPGQYEITE